MNCISYYKQSPELVTIQKWLQTQFLHLNESRKALSICKQVLPSSNTNNASINLASSIMPTSKAIIKAGFLDELGAESIEAGGPLVESRRLEEPPKGLRGGL